MEKIIKKELCDISWQVDEPTYRADPAISYSTLSSYAKKGIKGLKDALEGLKISSASLRHGSAVDTLLTDEENFENFYIIANYIRPSDQIRNIVDSLWEKALNEDIEGSLQQFSENFPEAMLMVINEHGYGGDNWKPETKIKKIMESGEEYYNLLTLTKNGKELIHQDDYALALACVDEIKNNQYTRWLFEESENSKIYYQLKFKMSFLLERVDSMYLINKYAPKDWQDSLLERDTIRCMFDIIHVDYENKVITPIDLKTTSFNEEDFGDKAFYDWYYDLQSTMYSHILREICAQDEYFKDFKIKHFTFLPINKLNLNPQFFIHPESSTPKQNVFYDYMGRIHKPWYQLLEEVRWFKDRQDFRYMKSTVENNGYNII